MAKIRGKRVSLPQPVGALKKSSQSPFTIRDITFSEQVNDILKMAYHRGF